MEFLYLSNQAKSRIPTTILLPQVKSNNDRSFADLERLSGGLPVKSRQ